jgi:hypothetical protein
VLSWHNYTLAGAFDARKNGLIACVFDLSTSSPVDNKNKIQPIQRVNIGAQKSAHFSVDVLAFANASWLHRGGLVSTLWADPENEILPQPARCNCWGTQA